MNDRDQLFDAIQAALAAHGEQRAVQRHFGEVMTEGDRIRDIIEDVLAQMPTTGRRSASDWRRAAAAISRRIDAALRGD